MLAVIDGAYISVGVAGLARARPAPVFVGIAVAVVAVLLFLIYFLRADIYRRRKPPVNPLGFPSVEA